MATKLPSVLLLLSLASCAPGWVYTNITTPYCTDMDNVTADGRSSSAGLRQFSIPRVPGSRAVWSSNALADAVKENNIKEIYYCDREQFSILGGVWGNDTVVVYGK